MFNQTKKGDAKGLMPTSNINLIGNGTTINGDIACEGDIRIGGYSYRWPGERTGIHKSKDRCGTGR
jgi:hypothetical protein